MNPLFEADILQRNYEWFCLEGHPFGHNGNRCQYRTEDDRRCAIGCVLPPEVDTFAMDSVSQAQISDLLEHPDFNLLRALFAECRPAFLDTLQSIHDNLAVQVDDHELSLAQAHTAYEVQLAELAEQFQIDWVPGRVSVYWPTQTPVAPIPSAV